MDPPEKPDESDCCNSGCLPCIFDVYEEQLKRYEKYLKNPISTAPILNCIDQLKYTKFKLISKIEHTVDTRIYIFEHVNSDKNDNYLLGEENHDFSAGINADDEGKIIDYERNDCVTTSIIPQTNIFEDEVNSTENETKIATINDLTDDKVVECKIKTNNLCNSDLDIKNDVDQNEQISFKSAYKTEENKKTVDVEIRNEQLVNENAKIVQTEKELIYKPGQHFLIKAYSQRDKIYFTRAYTPIPWDNLKSQQFAILIRFYETGEMSSYLKRLKIGTNTFWRGPYGDYELSKIHSKHLLMIAQGTGIAPIYTILTNLLSDEECEAVIKLFYCCRDSEDILLRENLYGFCRYWNFSYEVFISRGEVNGVKYDEVVHGNRLDFKHVEDYAKGKEGCFEVMVCGSKGFEECVSGYVKKCNTSQIYLF